MLDDAKILEIVMPIFRAAQGPASPEAFRIESIRDHDGEPALRLTIHHPPNAPKFDARVHLDAVGEAMRQLSQQGDDRFLFVRNLYADGDPALDEVIEPPRRGRQASRR